jgi:hypothetical protein
MRPILRGKYLDERLRHFPKDAADNHIKCPDCGGWIDVSDLVPSWITPGPCRIQQLISRSDHLET